jgi:DNA-binding transcriptional MocR family regulator
MEEGALSSAFRTVARSSMHNLSGYWNTLGYLPLRQQLQARLKELQIQAPVEQIMLTEGATEALHLVVLAKLRRGARTCAVGRTWPFPDA